MCHIQVLGVVPGRIGEGVDVGLNVVEVDIKNDVTLRRVVVVVVDVLVDESRILTHPPALARRT